MDTSTGSMTHDMQQCDALPLVSCVMVTCGRPEFVARSLMYYRRQSYPARELVIVYEQDSDLPAPLRLGLADEPSIPSIRLVRVQANLSIGAKRNRSVAEAHGAFIAQWDDDDWYGPERLSVQIAPLLCGSADITGLFDTVFFELDAWRFWTTTPGLHARMFVRDVHGGTLVFRRSAWGQHACYPDTSLREDADFLVAAVAQGARVVRLSGRGLYLYVRHGENTWRFASGEFLDSTLWRTIDEPSYLATDRDFYRARLPVGTPLERPGPVSNIVATTQQLLAEDSAPDTFMPSVACIMPTCDRETFVRRSVRYFQRQTYQRKQLIVVDDGIRPVRRALPDDERIRYIRLSERTSLGTKRNLACEATNADVIIHWDDDDWMAPTWVETQVRSLQRADADVSGLQRLYFYDPVHRRAWRYSYPVHGRPWVAGATLCYTRSFWQRNRFLDITRGEDLRFVWDASKMTLTTHDELNQFIAFVHQRNTIARRFIGSCWQVCPVEHIERLLLGKGQSR